jgi:uncharacterized metal-binding protein
MKRRTPPPNLHERITLAAVFLRLVKRDLNGHTRFEITLGVPFALALTALLAGGRLLSPVLDQVADFVGLLRRFLP